MTVVPEAKQVLDSVSLIGGKLIASYLVDARSEVRVYGLTGKQLSTIDLPGLGTVSGFGGKDADAETFFAFTSFNRPTTVYRYDASTGQASEWAVPKLTFDPELDFRRTTLLHVEGRHSRSDVHRPQEGQHRARADHAVRIRRVQHFDHAVVQPGEHRLDRTRRHLRRREYPRRRRVRQSLA